MWPILEGKWIEKDGERKQEEEEEKEEKGGE